MLFMHSCNYFAELNVWSGCIYFTVLSYRFPIVIGMLPTDWFRSRYPVIPISFPRPIFPFPFPFPTKKYSCGNGWGVFPTVPDRFHPYSQCNAPHIQSPSWTVRCLGYWLHGTIPKVPWLWVHPGCCGLCLQMGGSVTLPSCRRQACDEDVSWNHLPLFRNTKDGYKWRGPISSTRPSVVS